MVTAYLLVILTGVASATSGVALRWAQDKNLLPSHLLMLTGFCGAIYFGLRGHAEWANITWPAILIGIVGGATQYIPVRLFKRALELGPLSPAWCTLALGEFVPVIVFSMVFLGEELSVCRIFSLAATFIAIVFASLGGDPAERRRFEWRKQLMYLGYLVVIFLMAGVLGICLKYGADGELASQQNVVMCLVYLMLFLMPVLEITAARRWTASADFWICGGVFTLACLVQYSLILFLVSLPAILVFALSNTVSLLAAAIFSTCFFHEKRTWQWYAMLAAALAAILLNR